MTDGSSSSSHFNSLYFTNGPAKTLYNLEVLRLSWNQHVLPFFQFLYPQGIVNALGSYAYLLQNKSELLVWWRVLQGDEEKDIW